jgi:hypothetical protein
MKMSEKVSRGMEHASYALGAYAAHGGSDPGDETTVAISDLIVDLLHLAELWGVLPSEMQQYVAVVLHHYDVESDPGNADEEV